MQRKNKIKISDYQRYANQAFYKYNLNLFS